MTVLLLQKRASEFFLVSNLGTNNRFGTLMNLLHLSLPSIPHRITSPTHVI